MYNIRRNAAIARELCTTKSNPIFLSNQDTNIPTSSMQAVHQLVSYDLVLDDQ